jgi:hypothetical protein
MDPGVDDSSPITGVSQVALCRGEQFSGRIDAGRSQKQQLAA